MEVGVPRCSNQQFVVGSDVKVQVRPAVLAFQDYPVKVLLPRSITDVVSLLDRQVQVSLIGSYRCDYLIEIVEDHAFLDG